MKIYKIFFLSIITILISCNSVDNLTISSNVLRINETKFPQTLSTKNINDVVSSRILMQVFEGLVKYDVKHMTIIPAVAKSWVIDSTETVYTFDLRQDAFFHDNKCFKDNEGRQITAHDFLYTFERLCTKTAGVENFFGFYDNILGATEFHEASKTSKPNFSIKGIKAIDDFTLEIVLKKPFFLFLNILANPISSVVPKEGIETYGSENYVGCGPFYFGQKPNKNNNISLVKNEDYYLKDFLGNNIPFLDSVIISFVQNTEEQVNLLENNKLDIALNFTTEEVNEFLGVHKKDFEANPPKFIMESANNSDNNRFNVKRSYVTDFYINEMGFADYSLVKIQELIPLKEEIE